jgi:hypothetical protein
MNYYHYKNVAVSELIGKIMESVTYNKEREEILFVTTDGDKYVMYHEQDCCESVRVEEVIGDLNDLVGNPILMAEEVSQDVRDGRYKDNYVIDSGTWTFYKFATIKGYVTLRWLGESNGYYSERVDFKKIA